MKTIKSVLAGVAKKDYNLLIYAFNHQIPQVVKTDDGFIGVHVADIKGLTVEQATDNGWAIGKMKSKGKEE